MATITLSDALRLAADLTDNLDWHHGITWSGTDELHLHAHDPADERYLLVELERLAGPGTNGRLAVADEIVPTTAWALDTGLRVEVYGPRWPSTDCEPCEGTGMTCVEDGVEFCEPCLGSGKVAR